MTDYNHLDYGYQKPGQLQPVVICAAAYYDIHAVDNKQLGPCGKQITGQTLGISLYKNRFLSATTMQLGTIDMSRKYLAWESNQVDVLLLLLPVCSFLCLNSLNLSFLFCQLGTFLMPSRNKDRIYLDYNNRPHTFYNIFYRYHNDFGQRSYLNLISHKFLQTNSISNRP